MKFILYLIFIVTGGVFIFSLYQFTLYNGFGEIITYVPVEKKSINTDTTRMPMRIQYSFIFDGKVIHDTQNVSNRVAKTVNVDTLTVLYNKTFNKSVLKNITGKSSKTIDHKTGMQISAFFFIIFFLIYKFGDLEKWEGIYFRGEYVVHKHPTKTSQIIRRIINILIVSTTLMLLIRIIVSIVMIYLFNGFNNKFDFIKVESKSLVEFDSVYLKKHISYEYFIDKKGYKKSESVAYNKIAKYNFFEDKIYVNKQYPALSYIGNNKLVLQQNNDKIIFSVLGLFLLALLFAHVNINKIMELKEARKKKYTSAASANPVKSE